MNKNSNFYPKKGRVILHIDMNAFYCSVHEAVEPEKYRGKPCAVSGSVEQRKGIIVTSSYSARDRGVRTAMQVREALKICPELILIRPDFDLYRKYSLAFREIVRDYSPLVEVMSIDECFVDITGSKAFGTPVDIARTIQRRIMDELSLPCSVGIAPNKLLAKTASDLHKPNGMTVLRLRDVPAVLWPRPCSFLYGIGAKTAAKLEKTGIRTLGELACADAGTMRRLFGEHGPAMVRAAQGLSDSPVRPDREASKSVGHSTTLPHDYTKKEEIHRVLLSLADQAARRLRKKGMLSETVQLAIRDPGMRTITRATKLSRPTDDASVFYETACRLFDRHWPEGDPVRLLGVTLQNLHPKRDAAVQLDLFDYAETDKKEKLSEAMDRVRDKFGENALFQAGMLGDERASLLRDPRRRGTSLQTDFLEE